MKNRMKYWLSVAIGVMTLAQGCQSELLPSSDSAKDGYITLNVSVSVPDMADVQTRAVDPDGGGVQNITLFCFDQYDLFVSTVSADVRTDGEAVSLKGSFTARIPDYVKTVHLVGNQNLTYFNEGNYTNRSEVEVMTSIQASAGRMIYWARKDVSELVSGSTVELLRNQAKVTVNVYPESGFVENGWIVVNTNAFGTVAPYNSESGFVAPTIDNPFVTPSGHSEKLTSYYDVRISDEEYFFETENTIDDPVDMIIKGSQDGGEQLYYRISMLDAQGEPVMIMRNHHYTVNIAGALSYGQKTYEEALAAPATNNVWVSISDNVKTVYDNGSLLSVDETFVVIGEEEFKEPNIYVLKYTVKDLAGGTPEQAQVYWLDGNNVASHMFEHVFTSDGKGEITISLMDMGDEIKREGTLFIKSGRLNRKIKVVTVKEQNFMPAWITTNIYGVGTGENVTLMFTVPETCPQELFPMEVLLSSSVLDIRSESGMALPIRRSGEEGYGEDNGIGYKYVLNVTSTGTQRVYLETSLEQKTEAYTEVRIEAEHFESLTKTATFHAAVDQQILLHNLRSYIAQQPADEAIYYYLVPQKVNAIVEFPTHLGRNVEYDDDFNVVSYETVLPGEDDEFLLYSQYLNHNTSSTGLNFDFYAISEDLWSSGGRVYGFVRNDTPGEGAVFHMITNSSRSAEVVRVASNPKGSPSVKDNSRNCEGSQYKSAVFELSNFHPFHFAATLNGTGQQVTGSAEEVVDNVEFAYVPGQNVSLEFDVTSFTSSITGNDGKVLPSDEQVSVDPFGTSFKVYIDAPMLEIDQDNNVLPSSRFYEESDGRFVYVVNADRDQERMMTDTRKWEKTAAVADLMDVDYIGNAITVDQSGERKSLPFKTKSIVCDGEIVISSEEDVVVFYQKKFKVTNEAVTGTIRFGTEQNNAAVPYEAFVPFEVLPTYNRIGVMTITSDGIYELHLRKEYQYNWNTDDVKLQYVSDGIKYEKVFDSLSELYSQKDILLTPVR